jgi:uncharacterized protein YndB with AHSA1/START domain
VSEASAEREPEPIVIECDLPEAPAKVWRALTERELLSAWLMPNDLRPEVGARFRFYPEGPDTSSIDCEVLRAEPEHTLQWRQSERADPESGGPYVESVVTVELTRRADGGTHMRVVQAGFELVSAASHLQSMAMAPKACATVAIFERRGRRDSVSSASLSPAIRGGVAPVVCCLRRAA